MRWWDDPEQARSVLELVDGSDVEQGVATAALGYHALAKERVAPLAEQTLVDAAQINAALFDLDVSPVAKALARATEPIMGEASAHYGELLARDIHAKAMAAASTTLAQLTAAGVPPPLAIDRMAEVVGLPVEHSAKFVTAMKAPAVAPIVKADAADRALMVYAGHLGYAEAHAAPPERPVEEVSKTVAFEIEHPRDDEGKFATKGGDPRARRLARMARMERMEEAAPKAKPKEHQSLAQVARSLLPAAREAASRELVTREVARRPLKSLGRAEAVEQAPVALGTKTEAIPPLMKPATTVAEDVTFLHTGTREAMNVMVSQAEAEKILAGDVPGFTVQHFEQALGRPLQLFTEDATHGLDSAIMREARSNGVHKVPGQPVILRISGDIPIRGGGDGADQGIELASAATLRIKQRSMAAHLTGTGQQVALPQTPIFRGQEGEDATVYRDYPVFDLELVNEGDFTGAPKVNFGKAHAEEWSTGLRLVSRDEEGQFASADVSQAQRRINRRARMARMDRMERMEGARPKPKAKPAQATRSAAARELVVRPSGRAKATRQMRKMEAHQRAQAVLEQAVDATDDAQQLSKIAEMAHMRSYRVSDDQFAERFGHYAIDFESGPWGRGDAMGVAQIDEEARGLPTEPFLDSVMDWVRHGVHSSVVADGLGTPEAAIDAAAQMQRAFDESHGEARHRPSYFAEESVPNGWVVRQTFYTSANQSAPVFVVGSDPAMDTSAAKLETKADKLTDDTLDLERYLGIPTGSISEIPVPLVVVRLSVGHDEEQE